MQFPRIVAAAAFSLLFLTLPCALRAQSQPAGSDADSAAIKQTCTDFSESFTRHDAHAVAMTFADDADFTNMRGIHSNGRKDIEKWFSALFTGNLKDSVRTDTVRSIRYFSPESGGGRCRYRDQRNEGRGRLGDCASQRSHGRPDGQEERPLVHRHVSRIGISRDSPGPGKRCLCRFRKMNPTFSFLARHSHKLPERNLVLTYIPYLICGFLDTL